MWDTGNRTCPSHPLLSSRLEYSSKFKTQFLLPRSPLTPQSKWVKLLLPRAIIISLELFSYEKFLLPESEMPLLICNSTSRHTLSINKLSITLPSFTPLCTCFSWPQRPFSTLSALEPTTLPTRFVSGIISSVKPLLALRFNWTHFPLCPTWHVQGFATFLLVICLPTIPFKSHYSNTMVVRK